MPFAAHDPAGAFSVVVPVFNESDAVGETLERLLRVFGASAEPTFEIVVVDDGSTDGSAGVVETVGDDRIRVIRHDRNRGYGAALKTGVRAARFPWVFIVDADHTYPIEAMPELLPYCGEYDMVVGARTLAGVRDPWLRRITKAFLRKLASRLSGEPIPDLNSGMRVFRRVDALRLAHLLPNGFSYTTTITLALLASAQPIRYVPIQYASRRGKSKVRPIADTLAFLQLTFRTVLYFDPLRVFVPLAAVCAAAAVLVGVGSALFLERIMDASVVILLVTAVQLLGLGMLADVLNRRPPGS
jgi:glycosyltransferase involved in cell wall biosynthesis